MLLVFIRRRANFCWMYPSSFVAFAEASVANWSAAVLRKPVGDVVQSLVPRCLHELTVLPYERRRQTVLMVDERVPEAPFHAEHPHARLVFRIVEHGHDALVLVHLRLDAAPDAAVRTRRRDRPRNVGCRNFGLNRARGTDRQALPARRTYGFQQRPVHERADATSGTRAEKVNRADELVPVLASLGAPPAQDAVVHGDVEDRVACVDRFAVASLPPGLLDLVMIQSNIQLTVVFGRAAVRPHHRLGELKDVAT